MKFFKSIILIFIFILFINHNVYAEEDTGGGSGNDFGDMIQEFDDLGRVVCGEVIVRDIDDNEYTENRRRYVVRNYPVFLSKRQTYQDMYIYTLRKYGDADAYYDLYTDSYLNGELREGSSGHYTDNPISNEEIIYYPLYEFESTLPIFNEDDDDYEENVRKYFEEGDTSGTENEPYIQPAPHYDDGIELPQNFKVIDGISYIMKERIKNVNKDIIIKWDQTVDTSSYKYDIFVEFEYDDVSNDLNGLSVSEVFESDVFYSSRQNITVTIGQTWINNVLNEAYSHQHMLLNSEHPQSTCYLRSMTIKVRNKIGDQCSNFVETKINFIDKTAKASETDNDGNTVDNAQYDNTDVFRNDDDVDGGNVGSLSDFSSIVDYIKGGFGIFNKGGLVDLMSSFFGTIFPPMFWNLILLGFGVVILIGIINFILKR